MATKMANMIYATKITAKATKIVSPAYRSFKEIGTILPIYYLKWNNLKSEVATDVLTKGYEYAIYESIFVNKSLDDWVAEGNK